MTFIHGKNTFVSVNAVNISAFTSSTDFNDGVTTHKVTTYGPTRERESYAAGLGDGKISLKGTHDDGVTGPRKVLKALMAAKVETLFLLRHQGTGAGKPQASVNVIVSAYNESLPVDGMIAWTAELQMSGDLNEADQ